MRSVFRWSFERRGTVGGKIKCVFEDGKKKAVQECLGFLDFVVVVVVVCFCVNVCFMGERCV